MDHIEGTNGHRSSRQSLLGGAVCSAMLVAVSGLLLAVVFGAAPANLLFLGMLLACSVGVWIIYRYDLRMGRFRRCAESGRTQ